MRPVAFALALLAVVGVLVTLGAPGARDVEAATVLTPPAGVAATVARTGTVTVRWRARARGATRHEVRTTPRTRTRKIGRSARSGRITGLRRGRTYRIHVRACARTRCGRSATMRVRIPAAPAPPAVTAPGPGPGPTPAAGAGPVVGGCPVFPADNVWNRDISREPVDPNSDAYLRSIGLDDTLHPDFGSGRYGDYGIPFDVVGPEQPLVPIRFTAYGDESDPGPYPIPPGARIEGGGDRHVLVVRTGECKLYELYRAARDGDGWSAESGAVYDLRAPRDRPAGWTSADAAGLPILPGLARADEATAGAIRHALRFTVSRSQRAYVAPARHFASSSTDPSLPPMGLRLRLRADVDRSAFTGQARAILDALATYGMIVADNGSDWFVSGTPDPLWDDEDLDQLKRVPGSAFEVVRAGPLTRE